MLVAIPQILIFLQAFLAIWVPVALASYFDKDDRQVLSKNIKVVGFSAEEQEQAMRCMGYIYCPSGNDGMGALASAGAVCSSRFGNQSGTCSADRIATAAHEFVDVKTNKLIPRLHECKFRNYRGHLSELKIKDLRSIQPGVAIKNPFKNMREDKVVVRLRRPIPGCDPYELFNSLETPPAGTEIFALTHIQVDQAANFDGTEPLALKCDLTRAFHAKEGLAGVFYSNCDVNPGGSGGFSLIRDADRKLRLAGLFIRCGAVNLNGQSYNEEIKNYTISVGTNADFVRMLSEPGQKSYSVMPQEQKGR